MPSMTDKPNSVKTGELRNWLKTIGVPQGQADKMVKMDLTMEQIEEEIAKWLRDRPKKKA